MPGSDQTGRAGEHFVAGELNRRGSYASPFSGTVPGIDIVATDENQQSMAYIQVKTKRGPGGSWQVSLKDGWRFPKDLSCLCLHHCDQHPTAPPIEDIPIVETKDDHYWVFVDLARKAYTVVPDHVVREDLIRQSFLGYLQQKGGTRPGNHHASMHNIIQEKQVRTWEGRWSVLGLGLDDERG